MGKILLMVAIGLTVISAVLGVVNHGKLDSARSEIKDANAKLKIATDSTSKFTTEIKSLKDQVTALSAKNEEATTALTGAKGAADKASQQLQELQTQIASKDTQITQLQQDNEAKTAKITELTNGQPKDDSENKALKAQLAEQQALAAAATEKLTSAQSQLKDLQTEKQERLAHHMRDGLEGTIAAVNPSWNFVILNIGDRNGVLNNSEMLIKRGNTLIGKVRITSVERAQSVADIIANSVPKGVTIQPGDRVIYQTASDESQDQ